MGRFGFGQAVRRTEDQRLLTGTGVFVDDVNLPGQAHAYVLRSPVAHAEILGIDAAPARGMPGVLAVLTGAEVAEDGLGMMPCLLPQKNRDGTPMNHPAYPILAQGRVRHVGQPVALIVAETLAQAQDAAEAVLVEYSELPAVTEAVAALQDGAPQLHEEAPGNLCVDWEDGDAAAVDAAFARAATVAVLDLVNNRVVANSMETRGVVAGYDDAEGYFVHTTSQGSHHIRTVLCDHILKVPQDRMRVVTKDVGGGFGMKFFGYPEHAGAAWAARRLGRPVKWISERGEAFLSDVHGRDHVTRAELALDADAKMLALRVHTTANLGAYLSNFAPMIPTGAGKGMQVGVYAIGAGYVRVKAAFTNTVPVDAYRGAGRPEAAYLIERLVDVAAFDLGMDPGELRARNYPPASAMPFASAMGHVFDRGDFLRLQTIAREKADWDGLAQRREAAAARGRLRGIGLSYYIEKCGGGGSEAAMVRVERDRSVTVLVGSQNNGQGHETAYAQLVADTLGVPFESIRVVQGDTAQIPTGRGTGGSRSLPVGGNSCINASRALSEKGREAASMLLEAAASDVEYVDGQYRIVGTDRAVSLFDVAAAVHEGSAGTSGEFSAREEFTPQTFTYPNGCHICEVEVDPDTGVVQIMDYLAVDDFGRVINPMLLGGQVHGGIVQGIGQALYERTVYDPESGQLLTGSFMDYCLPRADNLPPIRIHYEEIPCVTNPLGIKGAGEAGSIGAPPAVISAVANALGVRHIDMPATPERVWTALQERRSA